MATADMAVDQMPAGYLASLLLAALSAAAPAVVAVSARYESAYIGVWYCDIQCQRFAFCVTTPRRLPSSRLRLASFYRAMHFSAKRGIAIACRLSVTLVNCDHIGWNSSKIFSPLLSLGCSLFDPNMTICSKGNTPKFGPKVTHPPVDLSVGDIRSQIAAEWLQIAQQSQWRACRKPPSRFLMVPSLTSTTSPSPKMAVPYAPNIREWQYLCNL